MIKAMSKIKSNKAFTLVELIVVIAIIGVLSAIIVPTFIGSVRKSRYDAINTRAEQVFVATDDFLRQSDSFGFSMADVKDSAGGSPVPVFSNFIFEKGVYKSGELLVKSPATWYSFIDTEVHNFDENSEKWKDIAKVLEEDFSAYLYDTLRGVEVCTITVYFMNNRPVQIYYSEGEVEFSNLPKHPIGLTNGIPKSSTDVWLEEEGYLVADDGSSFLTGTYPIIPKI